MSGNSELLVADDDRSILDLIQHLCKGMGVNLSCADRASGARSFLENPNYEPSAIILDWELPDGSGIQLLNEVKAIPRLRLIPVIMLTARSNPDDVQAGIRAGAFYYLTKPFDRRILQALIRSALDKGNASRTARNPAGAMTTSLVSCSFNFRTMNEAREIAEWLSSCCPDPEAVRFGLHELMINAIEHGNLGITYEEKTELNHTQTLYDEVKRRLELPENQRKHATISFSRKNTSIDFLIKDEGTGFDFEKFLALTPDRAYHGHGRGIFMTRTLSFDLLEYNPPGNSVRATLNIS